jgi:hypothetical protein
VPVSNQAGPAGSSAAEVSDPISGTLSGPRRRTVVTAISVIPVAVASAMVLGAAGCTSPSRPDVPAPGARVLRFFSAHQAAVVEAAAARIVPGPEDDPAEKGHPGAREAGVTDYIDMMLGALGALSGNQDPPAMIFAGGPWSNRHTSGPDPMASFVALDPVARIAWRKRLAGWQQQYTHGVAALDKLAGGDFAKASAASADTILARQDMSTFTSLLFEHTIEGMYGNPEYGGNRGLAGWKDIGFPGDVQPQGYSAAEVERSDGRDRVGDTPIVAEVLKILGVV